MSSSTVPTTHDTPALSDAQLCLLRDLLEEQRSFRCDQLDQLHRRDLLREGTDTVREINESLVAGARTALRDVLRALRRIDEGSYGGCRSCGDALPIERLEVLPQLSLCLSCQRSADTG